jgi:hypothetical protein
MLPTRITIRLDAVSAQRLHRLSVTKDASPSVCIRQLLNESNGSVRAVAPDMSLNCRAMIERLGDLRGELIACRRMIESGHAFGDPLIALMYELADAIDAVRLLILGISGPMDSRLMERR